MMRCTGGYPTNHTICTHYYDDDVAEKNPMGIKEKGSARVEKGRKRRVGLGTPVISLETGRAESEIGRAHV